MSLKSITKLKIDFVIVIVAFNSQETLSSCVHSVKNSLKLSNYSSAIIIVDNHPLGIDEDAKQFADEYIPNPKNTGFGAANNLALRKAGELFDYRFTLLLNPDAQLDEHFFTIFNNTTELQNFDVVSPRLILSDDLDAIRVSDLFEIPKSAQSIILKNPLNLFGVFNNSGQKIFHGLLDFYSIRIDSWITTTDPIFFKDIVGLSLESGVTLGFKQNYEECSVLKLSLLNNVTSFVEPPRSAGDIGFQYLDNGFLTGNSFSGYLWCGAAVILSRKYVETVGGFDERFFLYYEDTDFAMRGIHHNFLPYFAPELVVRHLHSFSTGKDPRSRTKAIVKSRSLFTSIHSGRRYSFLSAMCELMRDILRIRNRSTLKHFLRVSVSHFVWSFAGLWRSILPGGKGGVK